MPASKKTKTLSLVAATAALAIAGCGGGSDTSSSTTGATGATGASGGTPLSQAEFVSQANAVCADGNGQIEALQAPASNDLQSLGSYAQDVLDIADPLIQQLQAIVPPADLQSDYDAYVAAIQDQNDLDQQLAEAANSGDTAQVKSILQELQAVDTDPQAKALGLDECAKDAQPQG
ncbi:MAG: hypothetical protein QOI10_199 [Solirubrobacterales bacterium]|jgi:hypothetical protein|nr:hypothetical protein [Solirubrobacterales bacterium]